MSLETLMLNSPLASVIQPSTILFSFLLKNATVAYSKGALVSLSITLPFIVMFLTISAFTILLVIKAKNNKIIMFNF